MRALEGLGFISHRRTVRAAMIRSAGVEECMPGQTNTQIAQLAAGFGFMSARRASPSGGEKITPSCRAPDTPSRSSPESTSWRKIARIEAILDSVGKSSRIASNGSGGWRKSSLRSRLCPAIRERPQLSESCGR